MAFRNAIFVSPQQQLPLAPTQDAASAASSRLFFELPKCANGRRFTPVFEVVRDAAVPPNEAAVSGLLRTFLGLTVGGDIELRPWDWRLNRSLDAVSVSLDVELVSKRRTEVKENELAAYLLKCFVGQVLHVDQPLVADFQERAFKVTVTRTEVPGADGEVGRVSDKAVLVDTARLALTPVRRPGVSAAEAALLEWKANEAGAGASKLQPSFHFKDLGIGGLDKEFAETFRRAFASRMYPPSVIKRLGVQHVKGIMLYGPPGTGKTLIARKIGQILRGREPKIVNGPEILNKYVGQSEENIRNLFADAEADQAAHGDDSDLHIIIFDEIDAICKQRGTASGGTGVQDTVVNQLLSKIDGVNSLNNILIIGMTNRLDMIDEALLRPGRLEVHMEISLPDEEGRVQIFNIHTAKLREQGCLGADVDARVMASLMKNYSGAEITGVVRGAVHSSLFGHIKGDITSDFKVPENLTNVVVNMSHFQMALEDIKPAFGVDDSELTTYVRRPPIEFSREYRDLTDTISRMIGQVRESKNTPLLSVLLEGASASGKTAIACQSALESKFPFVKMVTPENMIGLSEQARCGKINKIFEDAYKSSLSLIVLDNLERLLDYVPIGDRFSNAVLQTLLVLIRKLPRHEGRRLMIIATGSTNKVLEEMQLRSAFDVVLTVPQVTSAEEAERVFRASASSEAPLPEEAELKKIVSTEIPFPVGIKKLLMVIEMFNQEPTRDADSFRRCVHSSGLNARGPIDMHYHEFDLGEQI